MFMPVNRFKNKQRQLLQTIFSLIVDFAPVWLSCKRSLNYLTKYFNSYFAVLIITLITATFVGFTLFIRLRWWDHLSFCQYCNPRRHPFPRVRTTYFGRSFCQEVTFLIVRCKNFYMNGLLVTKVLLLDCKNCSFVTWYCAIVLWLLGFEVNIQVTTFHIG